MSMPAEILSPNITLDQLLKGLAEYVVSRRM